MINTSVFVTLISKTSPATYGTTATTATIATIATKNKGRRPIHAFTMVDMV